MERERPYSRVAITGLCLALLSLVTAVAAGVGHRLGAWQFTTGFVVLKWAVCSALVSLAVSLAALYITRVRKRRRGTMLAAAGTLIAVVTVTPPLVLLQSARSLPLIHDITTDTRNPPAFVAILPLRQGAANPAEYGGPQIAGLQQQGYPEIKPVMLKVPAAQAFAEAQAVALAMGWQLVASDAGEGRIEATDTTFWFGFKDDVVIRITPQEGGSRVDVRSLSRVGVSDVGTNARRISRFLEALEARVNA